MYNKSVLLATSAALSLLVATPAFAQAAYDDVIVTSTKRATTLQETPVTVSVTTSDVINKSQIFDLKDLQTLVPSLRVSQLQNSANTSFSIRGFGNGGNNKGIEPAVGVFVDGVYRSRAAAQIGDLPSLERVEVLSGPQSTLFGKNASAGVISVVSSAPSFEQEGYFEANVGNYGLMQGKAYYTNALTDTLAFSVGGGVSIRDGYGDILNSNETLNELNRFNLRAQALYEPSDELSIRLIGDISQIDENCCITAQAISDDGTNGADSNDVAGGIRSLGGDVVTDEDQFSYETYLNGSQPNNINDSGLSAQIDYDFDTMTLTSITAYRTNSAGFTSDSDFTSLDILGDVYEDVEINTFTQELRLTSTAGEMIDWMIGGFYFDETIEQESGIIYGADTRSFIDTVLVGSPLLLGAVEGFNGELPGTYFADGVQIADKFVQVETAYSIFGTLDFHVNDRLTLTGGLNYTNDQKSVSGSTVNGDKFGALDLYNATNTAAVAAVAAGTVAGGVDVPGSTAYNAFAALVSPNLPTGLTGAQLTTATVAALGGLNGPTLTAFTAGVGGSVLEGLEGLQFQPQFVSFPNSVESGESDDTATTWTVRGAYEVNDNLNAYVSAATGYKSTSWNLSRDSRPFRTDFQELSDDNLLFPTYTLGATAADDRNLTRRFADPEEALVFEVGLKGRYDTFAFNAAAFNQEIENFQASIFQGTGFVLANAGKASVVGAEFDVSYNPVDSLNLTLAATVLDAVFDDYVGAPGPGGTSYDASGDSIAGVPELALSTSATYDYDINGVTGFIRGDYQYESDVQLLTNLPESITRQVSTFNGTVGVDIAEGLTAQVWAKNLFNDEYFTSGFPAPIQDFSYNAYPNPPRTYGLAVRKTF